MFGDIERPKQPKCPLNFLWCKFEAKRSEVAELDIPADGGTGAGLGIEASPVSGA